MSSIDDMKNKLNIEKLEKNKREELFNKFVEKGGKVVEDKKKNATVNFDRNKQKLLNRNLQNDKSKNTQINNKIIENKKVEKENSKPVQTTSSKIKKHPLLVFIIGFYQNIFSISGEFSRKFALNMNEDLPKIINEIQQISAQIENLETAKRWNAADLLNITNVFGYEIIARIYSLINKENIVLISNYFDKPRSIICNKIINTLYALFKNLVILYPYWESIKQVLNESQQIFYDITKINPLFQKASINKNIDRLFVYYLPRILTIISYNVGQRIPFDYNRMHEFAKIPPDKDMGSITKDLKIEKEEYLKGLQQQKEEQVEKIKDEANNNDSLKLPKFVQKGLELINELTSGINEIAKTDNIGMMFEENEKMTEFYFLFKEFDENYSFILTTAQIKLSPIMKDGVRIDIKSNFEKMYLMFNEILTGIKDYTKLLEYNAKLKEEYSDSPFVLQQKIKEHDKKRIHSFFELKGKAILFLKNLSSELQNVIMDYKNEKRLLQNGEDKLHFEIGKGNKKNKFEGVIVINSIISILSFTTAFYFYLTNGKLSEGSGLYFTGKK